ncbi:MAG TPA: plastocyanin/azurin family copper-binding protein [Candidatus Limnocylindria bacterium]|nr:plastocyanin/azurin family copper-binding protein [Candidatus Limnocylindria bacterium]
MTRRSRPIIALVGIAALGSACGSSGTSAPAAATAAPAAAALNVDVQGFKFPANLDVARGTKVTWTNKDTAAHTVTSGTRPTKDGRFDGQLPAAATFSFTFTEAGTYQYFCSIHSSMNGTITVK